MKRDPSAQFNALAKKYDAITNETEWAAPLHVIARIKETGIDSSARLKILDVGAGTGKLSVLLKEEFPNAEIYGVDASDKMLQIAVQHGRLDADKIKTADLTQKFPYKDGSFDLVVSSGTAEYLGDPKEILGHMSQVVKSGGHVISTFRQKCASNRILHFMGAVQNCFKNTPILGRFVSPIMPKTMTDENSLSTASKGLFQKTSCSAPYAAYIQGLCWPLPVQIGPVMTGPPVKYVTFSGQKLSEPAM